METSRNSLKAYIEECCHQALIHCAMPILHELLKIKLQTPRIGRLRSQLMNLEIPYWKRSKRMRSWGCGVLCRLPAYSTRLPDKAQGVAVETATIFPASAFRVHSFCWALPIFRPAQSTTGKAELRQRFAHQSQLPFGSANVLDLC